DDAGRYLITADSQPPLATANSGVHPPARVESFLPFTRENTTVAFPTHGAGGLFMRPGRTPFRPLVVAVLVVAGLGASSLARADDRIKGIITGHDDNGSVIVQTDSARLTIALNDVTRIRRIDGIRPVIVSSADLIPGLRIKAEGTFDAPDALTARRITFTRDDFKIAAAIHAGTLPTHHPTPATH